MQSRRKFLKQLGVGTGLFLLGKFPIEAFAGNKRNPLKITILHTNDTHSRIEPFPDSDKNFPSMGGVARRASLINKIREEEENVLLFDAGDFFQGTPYFNMYKGAVEIEAMNRMGYDACTLGNHEFDLGLEALATQLKKANFEVLCSNYDFTRTPLKGMTKTHKIFTVKGVRIGVFGIGVQLYGLVPSEAYGKTWHHEGIKKGIEISDMLKNEKKCDMVICLSHLGFEYNNESRASDVRLAKESKNIDLIIGGHTHTFLEKAHIEKNSIGEEVVIHQVGWGGVKLGRLDYYFLDKKSFLATKANTVDITK